MRRDIKLFSDPARPPAPISIRIPSPALFFMMAGEPVPGARAWFIAIRSPKTCNLPPSMPGRERFLPRKRPEAHTPSDLHDSFVTRNHHSLTARFTGKIPGAKTQFSASYKWIAGTALSPLDAFGEATYQVDPNLHLSVRQPLPGLGGRWEALGDFSNLLAQGYVTMSGQESRMQFVPVLRSFRGGVSFQF